MNHGGPAPVTQRGAEHLPLGHRGAGQPSWCTGGRPRWKRWRAVGAEEKPDEGRGPLPVPCPASHCLPGSSLHSPPTAPTSRGSVCSCLAVCLFGLCFAGVPQRLPSHGAWLGAGPGSMFVEWMNGRPVDLRLVLHAPSAQASVFSSS